MAKYPLRGRAGLGVIAAKTVEERGVLIGALIVEEGDEVLAITQAAASSAPGSRRCARPGVTRWVCS